MKRSSHWFKHWNELQKDRIIRKLGGKTPQEFTKVIEKIQREGDKKLSYNMDEYMAKYGPMLERFLDLYATQRQERDCVRIHLDMSQLMLHNLYGVEEADVLAKLVSRDIARHVKELGLIGLLHKGREHEFKKQSWF